MLAEHAELFRKRLGVLLSLNVRDPRRDQERNYAVYADVATATQTVTADDFALVNATRGRGGARRGRGAADDSGSSTLSSSTARSDTLDGPRTTRATRAAARAAALATVDESVVLQPTRNAPARKQNISRATEDSGVDRGASTSPSLLAASATSRTRTKRKQDTTVTEPAMTDDDSSVLSSAPPAKAGRTKKAKAATTKAARTKKAKPVEDVEIVDDDVAAPPDTEGARADTAEEAAEVEEQVEAQASVVDGPPKAAKKYRTKKVREAPKPDAEESAEPAASAQDLPPAPPPKTRTKMIAAKKADDGMPPPLAADTAPTRPTRTKKIPAEKPAQAPEASGHSVREGVPPLAAETAVTRPTRTKKIPAEKPAPVVEAPDDSVRETLVVPPKTDRTVTINSTRYAPSVMPDDDVTSADADSQESTTRGSKRSRDGSPVSRGARQPPAANSGLSSVSSADALDDSIVEVEVPAAQTQAQARAEPRDLQPVSEESKENAEPMDVSEPEPASPVAKKAGAPETAHTQDKAAKMAAAKCLRRSLKLSTGNPGFLSPSRPIIVNSVASASTSTQKKPSASAAKQQHLVDSAMKRPPFQGQNFPRFAMRAPSGSPSNRTQHHLAVVAATKANLGSAAKRPQVPTNISGQASFVKRNPAPAPVLTAEQIQRLKREDEERRRAEAEARANERRREEEQKKKDNEEKQKRALEKAKKLDEEKRLRAAAKLAKKDDNFKKRVEGKVVRPEAAKKKPEDDEDRRQRPKEDGPSKQEARQQEQRHAPAVVPHVMNATFDVSESVANSTFTVPAHPPPQPTKPKKKYEAYCIDDVGTDEDTDEEDSPRHVVPAWARDRKTHLELCKRYLKDRNLLQETFPRFANPTAKELFSGMKFHVVNRDEDTMIWDRSPTWDVTYDPEHFHLMDNSGDAIAS